MAKLISQQTTFEYSAMEVKKLLATDLGEDEKDIEVEYKIDSFGEETEVLFVLVTVDKFKAKRN